MYTASVNDVYSDKRSEDDMKYERIVVKRHEMAWKESRHGMKVLRRHRNAQLHVRYSVSYNSSSCMILTNSPGYRWFAIVRLLVDVTALKWRNQRNLTIEKRSIVTLMSNDKWNLLKGFSDITSRSSGIVNTTSERCTLWWIDCGLVEYYYFCYKALVMISGATFNRICDDKNSIVSVMSSDEWNVAYDGYSWGILLFLLQALREMYLMMNRLRVSRMLLLLLWCIGDGVSAAALLGWIQIAMNCYDSLVAVPSTSLTTYYLGS